jgi:competence protein ComEC
MQGTEAAAAGGRLVAALAAPQALRGRRLLWSTLFFASGVGLYFALPAEPPPAALPLLLAVASMLALCAHLRRFDIGPALLLLVALLLGLSAGLLRTAAVGGPVLPFRYHGAVEGRVVAIDRSGSDAIRVTLDRVRLDRVVSAETPRRVRISLHHEGATTPRPGHRVMTTAFLSPPSGPTEPGGFDFQRHAWFQQIGAVGYAKVPLVAAAAPPGGLSIASLRDDLGRLLRDRIPGQPGAVAVAIITGDRSGLSDEVVEDLRRSNLAHLLAISGLHMGLLVGFVFWAIRGGLALWPSVALRHPTRVWAALAAMPFAAAYLLLSGGSVATQRAFIMAMVMLGAIVLGRRALSLRSVALAALLILALWPEELAGPGFQMSFAATGALVVAFGGLARARPGLMRGWRGALVSLFLSSLVAGLATAPFAAAHFNRVGQFGLLANMLAVPAMGTAVMPLLLIGLLLWPIGLEAAPFAVATLGIEWILLVAEWVAWLPGSVRTVVAPHWTALPLLGFGLALIGCLGARARAVGGLVMAAGLVIWSQTERPDVLISDDGRLVGTMTLEGRHLSRASGASFVAQVWLENDGDAAEQEAAAERALTWSTGIIPLRRAADAEEAYARCGEGIVVASMDLPPAPAGCRVLTPETLLARSGAIALTQRLDGTWDELWATDVQGRRPWSPASDF